MEDAGCSLSLGPEMKAMGHGQGPGVYGTDQGSSTKQDHPRETGPWCDCRVQGRWLWPFVTAAPCGQWVRAEGSACWWRPCRANSCSSLGADAIPVLKTVSLLPTPTCSGCQRPAPEGCGRMWCLQPGWEFLVGWGPSPEPGPGSTSSGPGPAHPPAASLQGSEAPKNQGAQWAAFAKGN